MLIAAAVGAVLAGCGGGVAVETATVDEGPLTVAVHEVGTTRVRAHADVNAPVAGRWVPGPLRVGDAVANGARLGVLHPVPLDASARQQAEARLGAAEAALREMETRVTAARSTLDESERDRQRAETLGAAGGLSAQTVERARAAAVEARSALDGALARVRSAAYEREQARAVLAPARGGGLPITAPFGGVLLRLYEEHERVVPVGMPLAEVGDAHDLEVVVPVLTSDALRIAEGAEVRVIFGEADGLRAESTADTLRGQVRLVEPTAFTKISALGVEEQRVNVVVAVPATHQQVGDGWRVETLLTVWSSPQVLRVPTSALVRDGTQWFTWVVQRGRAARRMLQLGQVSDRLAEVRGGLARGDVVVLFPGDAVADGVRVRATNESRAR